MAKATFPRRGCVYRVSFGPLDAAAGHAIRKTRPAVVVSNDHLNEKSETVLVMPITSGGHSYYHWISVLPPEGGLAVPSRIVTEQIQAIDKRRIQRRMGAIRSATMEQVEAAIRDHFGLPEGNMLPP